MKSLTSDLMLRLEEAGINPGVAAPALDSGAAAISEHPPGHRFSTTLSYDGNSVEIVGYMQPGGNILFCTPEEAPDTLIHNISSTPDDRMMDSDRKWFEAHPNKESRVRKRMKGETPTGPPGNYRWVVVLQVRPGFRFRLGIPGRSRPNEEAALGFAREIVGRMRRE